MSIARGCSYAETWLLKRLLAAVGQPPVQLVVAGGAPVSPPRVSHLATVWIRDTPTLVRLLLDPEIGFGEAYADGRVAVQGDLLALLDAVFAAMPSTVRGPLSRLASWRLERSQRNTRRRSRQNVHHHYDLTTDFYRLWLDRQLVYTCAYFSSPSLSLEDAQIAKMDYVCRKVQLQPGETVVEAGCGWGALALHMARHYGVSVRAFNLSREQILYARRRAREEGLSRQVEFVEDDYRNISGRFDVFVSIGMLEHVGPDHYANLGRVIHRSIGDTGRGLLHFIGRNRPGALSRWTRKHIFPGAYAPTLRQVMDIFEPWNFSVLDVENLRLHYARTLEHWLERYERSSERVQTMFDSQFLRTWRLYLAASGSGFRVGTTQLFQVLFTGANCKGIPWTRAHLYQAEPRPEQKTSWIPAMS